jgi:hypothetical protein
MCHGGRLLAVFEVGTHRRPEVPEAVATCLTTTVDDVWVVWAHKVASPMGELFGPLTGGTPYPADAVAECRRGGNHQAPDPHCTCGFHAVSSPWPGFMPPRRVALEVALSGRTLAFEWRDDGVLFRAERQTVARLYRVVPFTNLPKDPPADPSGRLCLRRPVTPTGDGPIRLRIPRAAPPRISVEDDAGFCSLVITDDRHDDTATVTASSMRDRTPVVSAV